jgi:hypothetical protein
MASKYIKIGSIIATDNKNDPNGPKRISIGLGQKGKNTQYDLSVEVLVKDKSGKVVARQTDGFINLVDPRTQPDELLKAGVINEDQAIEMKNNASKLSEKVRYILQVPRLP